MIYSVQRIGIDKNAPAQAKYAAEELRYYFSMMTAKPYSTGEETENAVVICQTEDELMGEDGFRITPKEDHILLEGGKG